MSAERGRVVLTRDDPPLRDELARRGYEVLTLPCVRIEAADDERLGAAVRALGPADRLVITSAHGAEAVLRAVPATAIRGTVVAIGPATADRLARAGVAVESAPQADGASLAAWLLLDGGRVLLARSDRALAELPRRLRDRGAVVDEVVAYRTIAEASGDVAAVRRCVGDAVVVFASPSAVDGFAAAVGERPAAAAAIGSTTAAYVRAKLRIGAIAANAPATGAVADAVDLAAREVRRGARA